MLSETTDACTGLCLNTTKLRHHHNYKYTKQQAGQKNLGGRVEQTKQIRDVFIAASSLRNASSEIAVSQKKRFSVP